jgi:cephalosporin hydroxylase
MADQSNSGAGSLLQRLRAASEWRVSAVQARLREMQSDGLADHIRCRVQLGFTLPPLDTMQNYRRMKFLHDCIVQFAPATGVALEIGCYKCSSTVFIGKACARAGITRIFAIDLFTGTPSWNLSGDYLAKAQRKLASYGLGDQVSLIRQHSLEYPWDQPVAALHIDADHAYDAVVADIEKYTPFLVKGGIVVFDDYDLDHPGVTRAVHRLLAESGSYEVVAANYQGREFGSVCLRRVT